MILVPILLDMEQQFKSKLQNINYIWGEAFIRACIAGSNSAFLSFLEKSRIKPDF
jgi:hypothetical protein